ncbi:MAG: glycosyltransferase, partial [bacterium]
RLIEQKGHSDLLRTFRDLTEEHDHVHLVVVGDGPLEDELKTLAEDYSIDDSVTFTGFRSDVASIMQSFDAFVHPSLWEGFGLVFLEAMAVKLPVVATNVSAIPEIVVDGETGLLVPPESPDELRNALEKIVTSKDRREELGNNGYNRLTEEFSEQAMVDKHLKFYRKLL